MDTRKHRSLAAWFIALLALALGACDSTEPENEGPGEEELITRIVLELTDGMQTVTATADDPDGDGTDFQIDTLELEAGTTYSGTIELYDDVNGENITEEVEDEGDEHQLFYTVGGGAAGRVVVTATDRDENGLPVGLEFTVDVSSGAAASGTLRVVLSHYDDAPKDGLTRSDETDVDVTFPVTIR